MKKPVAIIAVLAGALALVHAGPGWAIETPIPGINIVVNKHPGGTTVATGQTNNEGVATFANLPAGRYSASVQPGAGKTVAKTFTLRMAGPVQISVKGNAPAPGQSKQTRATGVIIVIQAGGGGVR